MEWVLIFGAIGFIVGAIWSILDDRHEDNTD